MKKQFSIYFDSPNLKRKYAFDLNFTNDLAYEKALDWAEKTTYISEFLEPMNQRYGFHEILYNPDVEYLAFETYNVLPRYYIKVINLWHKFFELHKFDCGDILEIPVDAKI